MIATCDCTLYLLVCFVACVNIAALYGPGHVLHTGVRGARALVGSAASCKNVQQSAPGLAAEAADLHLCRYAFLLDRNGRVRFRGCGKAEAGERDTLLAAARQLVDARGR
jgi:ATP10 protein